MGYFGFVVVRDMIEQHNQVGEEGDNENYSETNENDNEAENNSIGVEEDFLNSI